MILALKIVWVLIGTFSQAQGARDKTPQSLTYEQIRQNVSRYEWTIENLILGFKGVPRPQLDTADEYNRPDTPNFNCSSAFPSDLRRVLREPLTVNTLNKNCPFVDRRKFTIIPTLGSFVFNADIQSRILLPEVQKEFGIVSYQNRQTADLPTWAFDRVDFAAPQAFDLFQQVDVQLVGQKKFSCQRFYRLVTQPVDQISSGGDPVQNLVLKLKMTAFCELSGGRGEPKQVFTESTEAWITGADPDDMEQGAVQSGFEVRSLRGDVRRVEPGYYLERNIIALKVRYQGQLFNRVEAMTAGLSPILLYYHLPIPQFGFMNIDQPQSEAPVGTARPIPPKAPEARKSAPKKACKSAACRRSR